MGKVNMKEYEIDTNEQDFDLLREQEDDLRRAWEELLDDERDYESDEYE